MSPTVGITLSSIVSSYTYSGELVSRYRTYNNYTIYVEQLELVTPPYSNFRALINRITASPACPACFPTRRTSRSRVVSTDFGSPPVNKLFTDGRRLRPNLRSSFHVSMVGFLIMVTSMQLLAAVVLGDASELTGAARRHGGELS